MFEAINGWTKKKILETIESDFKGRSSNRNGTCQYRGPKCKKCAVGLFIPDDKYQDSMENQDSVNLFKNFPSLKKLMPINAKGMDELQNVHDYEAKGKSKMTKKMLLDWVKKNVK